MAKSKQAINCQPNFHIFIVMFCCSYTIPLQAKGFLFFVKIFGKISLLLKLQAVARAVVLRCELSPCQWSPTQWDTHPPCPLSALQPLCYPLALLSRLCSGGALQCTGDRLLETNSPTQGSRLLTACLPQSRANSAPHAILLCF